MGVTRLVSCSAHGETHRHLIPLLMAKVASMELCPRVGGGVGGGGEPLAGCFLGRGWVDAELGCWTREEAVFLPSNSGRQRGRGAGGGRGRDSLGLKPRGP